MSGTETTSWRIVLGAGAGDHGLREEFVRCYSTFMTAWFGYRWRGSPLAADVGDAVQESFLECLRERGALASVDPDRPGGFRPYLVGLLRNVALRHERRRLMAGRIDLATMEELDRVCAATTSIGSVLDRAWAEALMREAAERMAAMAGLESAAQRRVELLRLRFQEQLPIREIARRWAAEPDDVHRQYAKARREYAAALRAVVVDHHPGSGDEIAQTMRDLVRALGR